MTLKPAEQWLAEMPIAPINRNAWVMAIQANALRDAEKICLNLPGPEHNDAYGMGCYDCSRHIQYAANELDPQKNKE